ncbi:MAG: hypothetical protein RL486_846 [Actinomycetota bacterium]
MSIGPIELVAAVHHRECRTTALADGVLIGVAGGDELLAAQCGDFLTKHIAAHLIVLANDVRDFALFKTGIRRPSVLAFTDVRFGNRETNCGATHRFSVSLRAGGAEGQVPRVSQCHGSLGRL